MSKKLNDVPDGVIKIGKEVLKIVKTENYEYSEVNNVYSYYMHVVSEELRQMMLGTRLVFALMRTKKHIWQIQYWKALDKMSVYEFDDRTVDLEKQVQLWTKYIKNFKLKMKKKCIFERTQKMREDFE
jgi:hypothetical protein